MMTPLLPPEEGDLRLVVFDWDGTLMDSPRRIVHCLQRAAKDTGAPVRDEATLRNIIGLGVQAAVRELYPDADDAFVQHFSDTYRECYLAADDAPETPLFAGVSDLLDWLDAREILLAVATSKSRRGLDQALEATGLGRYFVATATGDEYPSKPNPSMLQSVMGRAGVEPARTRMVGDSVYDLEMARHAGVPAVAVTHGVHSPERLSDESPLALQPDLESLLEAFRRAEGTT
ncbi:MULTISPECIES: HAD family hydrolase [unclassified Thioalkalivibrio]|uniref:HAD family hydrolase n=1 Tax=unclassified Thioalkalivibrio TaxID=2621013 RepID=UPI0003654171|nr:MULTISPECIES: HAD-IA family hydrolase [unclassified Thioalkalivibrio]